MELSALLRMLASLGLVLGLLALALWAVRRFDLRLPGRVGGAGRLDLVERVSLDPRRSVVLIRRDAREHLILLSPEGPLLIEGSIRQDKADRQLAHERECAAATRQQAQAEALARTKERFTDLLDLAMTRIRPEGAPCVD